MNNVELLLAIEDIKRLKARYCRAIDEKKLEQWRDIFCYDAVALTPQLENRPKIIGIDAIMAMAVGALDGTITVHHLHAPEIEILGDDEATGIWAMEDNIYWHVEKPNFFGAKRHFRGTGHYHEKYRRTLQGWRIAEMQLVRLHLERDGEPLPQFDISR